LYHIIKLAVYQLTVLSVSVLLVDGRCVLLKISSTLSLFKVTGENVC